MTIPVYFPDRPFVDVEAARHEQQFREFVVSKEYAPWARRERIRWEARYPNRVAWSRSQDWTRVRFVSHLAPQWGQGD